MAITVRELVAIPHLRTRFEAGASGGDRVIRWAHACELASPWEWLEAGDLLMTNGIGFPRRAADQVHYIEQLAAAGMAGVAIGAQLHAPPLTPEAATAADEYRLPVLLTAYEVPFAALTRTVASANRRDDQLRLAKVARIYERVRVAMLSGDDPRTLLARLGDELGCELQVLGCASGRDAFDPRRPLPASLRAALTRALAERGGQVPAVLRIDHDGERLLAVPVPAQRRALLVARGGDQAPGLALLQHVATIAALELERLTAQRESARRLGAETFGQLLDARLDAAKAQARLAELGFDGTAFMIVAFDAGERDDGDLHHRLGEHGLPNLLLARGRTMLVLVPGGESSLATLLSLLPPDARVGVRDGLVDLDRIPDGAREAEWALRSTTSADCRVAHYGEATSPFLPRTVSEAREAVERVLGPLLRYDAENDSELVRTLAVFLRWNRSWQRAAGELYVHRQSLVYRVRRIEEITGRRLDRTEDVAELWLALRALEVTEGRRLVS